MSRGSGRSSHSISSQLNRPTEHTSQADTLKMIYVASKKQWNYSLWGGGLVSQSRYLRSRQVFVPSEDIKKEIGDEKQPDDVDGEEREEERREDAFTLKNAEKELQRIISRRTGGPLLAISGTTGSSTTKDAVEGEGCRLSEFYSGNCSDESADPPIHRPTPSSTDAQTAISKENCDDLERTQDWEDRVFTERNERMLWRTGMRGKRVVSALAKLLHLAIALEAHDLVNIIEGHLLSSMCTSTCVDIALVSEEFRLPSIYSACLGFAAMNLHILTEIYGAYIFDTDFYQVQHDYIGRSIEMDSDRDRGSTGRFRYKRSLGGNWSHVKQKNASRCDEKLEEHAAKSSGGGLANRPRCNKNKTKHVIERKKNVSKTLLQLGEQSNMLPLSQRTNRFFVAAARVRKGHCR